jgi:hypothetical protein
VLLLFSWQLFLARRSFRCLFPTRGALDKRAGSPTLQRDVGFFKNSSLDLLSLRISLQATSKSLLVTNLTTFGLQACPDFFRRHRDRSVLGAVDFPVGRTNAKADRFSFEGWLSRRIFVSRQALNDVSRLRTNSAVRPDERIVLKPGLGLDHPFRASGLQGQADAERESRPERAV